MRAYPGPNDTVDVYVEPTVAISVVSSDTICDNDFTDVDVTSGSTATTGIKYSIEPIPDNPAQVSGYEDDTLDLAAPISQQLNNLSPNAQRVRYAIIPYTTDAAGAVKCAGTPDTVDVYVEPTVTISVVSSDTICDDETTDIDVTSGMTVTTGERKSVE